MNEHSAKHVSQMLELAKAKHAEAIAAVEARPIDMKRMLAAEKELIDVELLIQDCLDWTGDSRLANALVEVRTQKGMLVQGIASLEAAMQTVPSVWSKPWPWISVALLGLIVFQATR